jgi:L-glutamine:2-deoxy-scyllo-inosose/3-amino-2,3-dideoxy-scyllo-inosose aminotransferase
MGNLAITGASPIRDIETHPWPIWPVWDEIEEKGLLDVLHSGIWSYNGPKEVEFNKAYAKFIGTKYALSATNGTITLQLALEACGIGFGHEVIVPGLTWQATAATIADVNAIPVLVDVCEDTWCIDPNEVKKAITPRTKAIIPVHLYGTMADMDTIMDIAKKHNLRIIEDCAHKHGGEWDGKKAGSMGDVGSFSFQLSKLLTAGEGGAMTTNDSELYEKLDALRNCGRRPALEEESDKGSGVYFDEGNFIQSGNYRITDFQAVLLLAGLERLPQQNELREENAQYLNTLLAQLPGIRPMRRDDKETKGAYYNISFRYYKDEFKGLPTGKFREALGKELGCAVEPSYEPLNNCPLYKPQTKPSRYKIDNKHWQEIDPSRFELPVSEKIYNDLSVCFHHAVLMGNKSDLDLIGDAIDKIYKHAEELL